jgi:hypothetical protein
LTLDERKELIATGENYPTSALSVLAKLPENRGGGAKEVRQLDKRLDGKRGEPTRDCVGIVAVLGRSNENEVAGVFERLFISPSGVAGGDESHATSGRGGLGGSRAIHCASGRAMRPARFLARWPGSIASRTNRNRIAMRFARVAIAGERRRAGSACSKKWVGQRAPYQPVRDRRTTGGLAELVRDDFPKERPAELPKESCRINGAMRVVEFLDSKEGMAGSLSRAGVPRRAVHELSSL